MTSSSTSERSIPASRHAGGSPARAAAYLSVGLLRIVHPFPSALDAVAAATIAAIAGADPFRAGRLGLAMLFLQFAIGVANDLADTASDAISKPTKPLPGGLVSRSLATRAFVLVSLVGLGFAAWVGPAPAVVGVLGLADGMLYDVRLKGTAFGWVPFAAGVGLLPLYSWVGAGAALTAGVGVVAALAVLAGTALALANAYADLERDVASGTVSIATTLGARRTMMANVAILMVVQIVALATTFWSGGSGLLVTAEAAGCLLAWAALIPPVLGSGSARRLVWELQGVGIVVIGAAWLSALSTAGWLSR